MNGSGLSKAGPGGHTGTVLMLVLLAGVAACGSRSSSGATSGLDPIPECEEYERTFARCNGLDAGIMNQSAATPKTPGDRDRLRSLCTINLERLKQACR